MKVYEVISRNDTMLAEWSLNPLSWISGATANPAEMAAQPTWAGKLGVQRMANAQAEEAMAARMGAVQYIAKVLGFFYITVQLYINLDELEKAYNAGTVNSANYKKAHEAYVGLWMTQLMVPWLVKVLRVQKLVSLLVRVVFAIGSLGATAATGGALAPAALASMAVEQAAFSAIQIFLTSDTFKNWAKDYMTAFATIGYVPDELFNQLRKYVSDLPGMSKIMKNSGKTFYQSQDLNRSPEVRAKDKSAVDDNAYSAMSSIKDDPDAVIIAGQRVDDGKGGVNRLIAAGPQVQAALQLHPDDPMVQKFKKLKPN